MPAHEDSTYPELAALVVPRIASRMRFEDPAKFIEFYDKQLSKHIVGLPHPEVLESGVDLLVIVSPPGAPDALQMEGTVVSAKVRSEGGCRLKVEVNPTLEDMNWLDAYIMGLRVAVDWHQEVLVPVETPPPILGPSNEELVALSNKLDGMTYYELLEVPENADGRSLQLAFHSLTRRYHPDLFLGANDPDLSRAINRIFRRINEAYAVLKSARQRREYDEGLSGPAHTRRLRLVGEAAERVRRTVQIAGGETGPGDHYWSRVQLLLDPVQSPVADRTAAIAEAIRLLRIAVSFEPDNESFTRLLADFEAESHGFRPRSTPPPRAKPPAKQGRKKRKK